MGHMFVKSVDSRINKTQLPRLGIAGTMGHMVGKNADSGISKTQSTTLGITGTMGHTFGKNSVPKVGSNMAHGPHVWQKVGPQNWQNLVLRLEKLGPMGHMFGKRLVPKIGKTQSPKIGNTRAHGPHVWQQCSPRICQKNRHYFNQNAINLKH